MVIKTKLQSFASSFNADKFLTAYNVFTVLQKLRNFPRHDGIQALGVKLNPSY